MIRPAAPHDAPFVAPLIIQAMGDLAAKFANSYNPQVILGLFIYFFQQENNQYSYQNTLVFEENDQILGSLNAYDGAKLFELRENFLNYLKENNGLNNFHPEPETQEGEFYFDTISVHPDAQGKGIGKALIIAGIDWAKALGHQKIGLIVEKENPRAKELYENMGFIAQNSMVFLGGDYFHLTYCFEVQPT
ncbi:GNAT family N-acetyltransferase [Pedobacter agri]|uniref:GNAT family N-acetyltransferase n=1 Tax=Pedobacter agri TaxID=454586 RepID=UPI00292DCAF2|nr:GNAT family N-acetyltransferase [Pedobacter agri]